MEQKMRDGTIRGYCPYPQQPTPQQQASVRRMQRYQQQTQPALYQMQKPRRETILLISAVFATVWYIIVCAGFASILNAAPAGSEAEQLGYEIGAGIGLMLQIPFLITAFIGIVFNWLTWFMSKRGFAITAGVLFSVSVFLSIANAIGYIVCLVLCFIGAARLGKRNA